jgi:hypothetical protein
MNTKSQNGYQHRAYSIQALPINRPSPKRIFVSVLRTAAPTGVYSAGLGFDWSALRTTNLILLFRVLSISPSRWHKQDLRLAALAWTGRKRSGPGHQAPTNHLRGQDERSKVQDAIEGHDWVPSGPVSQTAAVLFLDARLDLFHRNVRTTFPELWFSLCLHEVDTGQPVAPNEHNHPGIPKQAATRDHGWTTLYWTTANVLDLATSRAACLIDRPG